MPWLALIMDAIIDGIGWVLRLDTSVNKILLGYDIDIYGQKNYLLFHLCAF